ALEEYARALAAVVRSFIAQPDWAGVRDIVLGGGFPDHEAGRLAIRRAARLLKLARSGVRLRVLAHDSDEGGLLGWVQLAPSAALRRQAFLAVDIGGTNVRCGIVGPRPARDRTRGPARASWSTHSGAMPTTAPRASRRCGASPPCSTAWRRTRARAASTSRPSSASPARARSTPRGTWCTARRTCPGTGRPRTSTWPRRPGAGW